MNPTAILSESTLQLMGGCGNILAIHHAAETTQVIIASPALVAFGLLQAHPWFLGYRRLEEQYTLLLDNQHQALWHAPPPKAPSFTAKVRLFEGQTWRQVLSTFTNIFVPLIPAFVAAGVLEAIYGLCCKPFRGTCLAKRYPNGCGLLSIFGQTTIKTLHILIGMSTMRALGGSLALGAVVSAILYQPELNGLHLGRLQLTAGKGGILAILMACAFASQLERACKRYVKPEYAVLLVPPLVVSLSGIMAVMCFQPIAAWLAEWLLGLVQSTLVHPRRWIAGGCLAGGFSPLVPWGLHHGFIPLYERLMESQGANSLTPIFAMADMGQIGAALGLPERLKDDKVKRRLPGAVLSACLGIGEPLLFGVTLPQVVPFCAGCLGSMVGGALVSYWGLKSTVSFGVSGLPLGATLNSKEAVCFFVASSLSILTAGVLTRMACWFKASPPPPNASPAWG